MDLSDHLPSQRPFADNTHTNTHTYIYIVCESERGKRESEVSLPCFMLCFNFALWTACDMLSSVFPLFLCHSSFLPSSCAAGGKFHFNVVKRLLALQVNGGLSQHIPHRVTESFMLHRIPHALFVSHTPLPNGTRWNSIKTAFKSCKFLVLRFQNVAVKFLGNSSGYSASSQLALSSLLELLTVCCESHKCCLLLPSSSIASPFLLLFRFPNRIVIESQFIPLLPALSFFGVCNLRTFYSNFVQCTNCCSK